MKLKVILTTLLTTLLLSINSFGADIDFFDVSKADLSYDAIYKLVDRGYIVGYEDGTFRPKGEITRGELVRIINQVFSYSYDENADVDMFGNKVENKVVGFTDVYKNDWFYNDVIIAQQKGYIAGFPDGSFRPKENVTRQQMCVILTQIMNFQELPFDKEITDAVSPWAMPYVKAVVSNRVMPLETGNTFRATKNITREEVCVALAAFVYEETEITTIQETTKEDEYTETTTRKNTSSVVIGGGSSSNSNSSQSTTEIITETATESTTQEIDLTFRMDRVISNLKDYVLPDCSNGTQTKIVNSIIDNMNNYKKDENYDYKSAAEETMNLYDTMSKEEKEELKDLIYMNNSTVDLAALYEFFFEF